MLPIVRDLTSFLAFLLQGLLYVTVRVLVVVLHGMIKFSGLLLLLLLCGASSRADEDENDSIEHDQLYGVNFFTGESDGGADPDGSYM